MKSVADAVHRVESARQETTAAVVRRGVGVNYSEVKKAGECVVKIFPGGYFVSHGCRRIETTLGSCVAACIRDPAAAVGGVNHFMLPQHNAADDAWLGNDRSRYGVHAMEMLINEILKRGGQRQRLEVKLFGGGHVISQMSSAVGRKNIEFARHYLATEGFSVAAENLGGGCSRRLIYNVITGEVLLKRSARADDPLLLQRDQAYMARISQAPIAGEIELFE